MSRLTLPTILAILTMCAYAAAQTQTQTLPQGFDYVNGSASTQYPQNTFNENIWQWHYDSSEFDTQAPITITDIAIRPKPGQGVGPFDFGDWRVTLIEATTNYVGHDPAFGRNILRSQVVRTGPWIGGAVLPLPGATVGEFIPMGLTGSFTYDPSTGNDFIIQIESCHVVSTWGTNADLASGLGVGRRYGSTSSCYDSSYSFTDQLVPVVEITYKPASQTLPRGFEDVDGSSTFSDPVATMSDQKWQWHYDSTEFEVQGPIVINEISVRVDQPGVALGAFSFDSFKVTLGPATTDYRQHSPAFAANIEKQKVVRSGPWSGGPLAGSAGSVGRWVALGLTEPFVYDPSTFQDFVVQIEKCGPTMPWNHGIDGRLKATGTGGGNRFGHDSDCLALIQNQSSALDVVPIIRIDYEPLTRGGGAIAELPYFESFDSASTSNTLPHGWLNVAGEAQAGFEHDWIVQPGTTQSSGTGPVGDHTTGAGQYAYVEDSYSDNERMALLSPCFDLSGIGNPMLGFWMHSLAADQLTNTLSVGVYRMPHGPFVSDVATFGDTGPTWNEWIVDLSAFAGETVRIVFEVDNDNGGGFGHDIAIDDVRVFVPSIQNGQAPTAFASLDARGALEANGIPTTAGVAGPYFADVYYGEPLNLTISGAPNQPFVLWAGTLDVGQVAFPGVGQLDVGDPGSLVIIDGAGGTGEIPGYFTTGTGSLTLAGPVTLPPGLIIPLQAAVFTGGPSVVALSNALVVEGR